MKGLDLLRVPVLLLSASLLAAATGQDPRPGRGFDRRRGGPPPPSPVMQALDADSDRTLSSAEIESAARSLATLDANADGNLTSDELRPSSGRRGGRGMMGMGPPDPLLSALDLDRDKELFEDEVTDAAVQLRTLDENGDGQVSEEELRPRRGEGGFGGFPRGGFGRGSGNTEQLEPDEVNAEDGAARLLDREAYKALSYQGPEVLIDTHLAGLEFVKFTVTGATTDDAKIYFINTNTHRAHMMFGSAIGLPFRGRGGGESNDMYGVLVYRPLLTSPSGNPGYYTFEFEPFDAFPYEKVKAAHDLLVEFAPILNGNLGYRPLERAMAQYGEDKAIYETAGLPVYLAENEYEGIGFLPLNHGTGFGRLRVMNLDERPGPRDVVIYPTLPNEMPRVAGIITAVRQTPLSHVNLRAIQDDIPNAFITGVLDNEQILGLIGKYVAYTVGADGYEIREASALEVEAHFADTRPTEIQTPPRNLSVTGIRSLDEIGFAHSSAFGVKSANIATLGKLGFPEGVVPAGHAVPFSFYDSFMKHNGFYEKAAEMIADPEFQSDTEARSKALSKFRKKIRKGEMPAELVAALTITQERFPAGTSIRARSSTNNEDLPGFSGAGLYDSFTHKADEGPLDKTIKQVYASLWNFRAFEERAFYRIDHQQTAMGVLLHPSYSGELANGVGVSEDIVYQSTNQNVVLFYVNAQVGEDLVTNPDDSSIPEEILLAPRNPNSDRLVTHSNRVEGDERILGEEHLLQLRRYLRTIDREFQKLYEVSADQPFSMEIEFKITAKGDLAIKQARPWVY